VPLAPLVTAAEAAAHQALVATLGEDAVWAWPGPAQIEGARPT
jgi:hypothetical protein